MKTLKEVKEYFKDAKTVKGLGSGNNTINMNNTDERGIHCFFGDYYVCKKDLVDNLLIYDSSTNKFAKILTYKTKQMKPKKEETKALYQLAKEAIEAPISEVCQDWKDKILLACPSLKKEDEKIEAGFWYKSNDGHLYFLTKIDNGLSNPHISYGINSDGTWHNESARDLRNEGFVKAEKNEVQLMLENHALKMGFKEGVLIRSEWLFREAEILKGKLFFDKPFELLFGSSIHCYTIFKDGKWATPIETISLKEAEKLLNKKIKIN